MLMRVGVIILAMEIYRVLCLLKTQNPLWTRSQVQTHTLLVLMRGDNQLPTQPTPESEGAHGEVTKATGRGAPAQSSNPRCRI